MSETYKIGTHTLTVRQAAGSDPVFAGKCDPASAPTTSSADLDCYTAIELLVKAAPSNTPVDIPGLPGAAIGVDPQTGEPALFVLDPSGSKVFELLARDHTKKQLIDLAKSMSAN